MKFSIKHETLFNSLHSHPSSKTSAQFARRIRLYLLCGTGSILCAIANGADPVSTVVARGQDF